MDSTVDAVSGQSAEPLDHPSLNNMMNPEDLDLMADDISLQVNMDDTADIVDDHDDDHDHDGDGDGDGDNDGGGVAAGADSVLNLDFLLGMVHPMTP